MGFRNGAFATVWQREEGKGKFSLVNLTISRKNPEGVYETEFSARCMFIGSARAKAERLKERDRICLTSVEVTNKYDKENKRELVNYKVFDFEPADAVRDGTAPSRSSASNPVEDNAVEDDSGNMPF